jgi:hypothetical protein
LPLAAQIGLEFGEHAEHIEERLAGGGAGVDGLLRRLQRDTAGLELVHDVLKVLQRARQAVDAGDHERVAGAQEIEQYLKFGAAVAARAACLLGPDHLAARRLQRGALDREILVEGGNPGVTVEGHAWRNVSLGCRPSRHTVSQLVYQLK